MMETLHKQEFRIRDLSTRSVTLFPTRAQVVREIKDVVLKPGANEITVVGLTPTADEQSIKVEGTGSAIITDITVELLPNRDIFQDIYPDSDDESEPEKSDSDDDDDDEEEDANQALEDAREKQTALLDKLKTAREIISSAEVRLRILDAHGASLDKKEHKDVDIASSIGTYRSQRARIFQDHLEGTLQERALNKEVTQIGKHILRLLKQRAKKAAKAEKAKAKVSRAKEKLRIKEIRREAERKKEKDRIRKERENFWPRLCYSVRITLDAASFSTPSSSRRSSIASASDVVKVAPAKEGEDRTYTCDLSLSYVTTSAFWSPTYDLALSTTANTATLCFDAQLTNMTSETWSNCKVILSTSQTTFAGLQDDIPTLVPWRVKLAGRGGGALSTDLVDSREERVEKGNWRAAQNLNPSTKPRVHLFGVGTVGGNMFADGQPQAAAFLAAAQVAPQAQAQTSQAPGGGGALFGGGPALFGGASNQNNNNNNNRMADIFGDAPPPPNSLMRKSAVSEEFIKGKSSRSAYREGDRDRDRRDDRARERSYASSSQAPEPEYAFDHDEHYDAATMLEPTPSLSFAESSFEETGLTATYDIPTTKTLKPSSTASKQRVARISFTQVLFSHTVIAKYKPVAYLKAKLRNSSPLTLLKGSTGLTLDGTFIGRSTLPRCSAGDTFTLSLGVDPAVKVAYPKPDVKRSVTGVFSKGDHSVYTRTVTLVNSRAASGTKPVNVTVLDQVPVSEDEKLRIEVSFPRGLTVGGAGVATGAAGKEGSASLAGGEKDWGKAVAVLKKGGEVSWDVQLAAGRSVKLVLQYEVMCPSGERVSQV